MKTILNIIVLILLVSHGVLISQNDTGKWGKNSRYNKLYDPATVITITGDVVAVDQIVPEAGTSAGIHITVKTKTESYPVHLGPKWYIDKQAVYIKIGDKVRVQGSKVLIDSQRTIIAREIVKGNSTLVLRDEQGKPLWSGKGKK